MKKKISNINLMKEMREKEKHLYYRIYLFFYRLFYRIIESPRNTRRAIVRFFQRAVRGWANEDTWGLCYYLAKTISESIQYLIENSHGMPNDLTEGQWVDILNEIRDTFDTAKAISENNALYIPTKEWSERKYNQCVKIAKDINKQYKDYPRMRVLTKKQAKKFEAGFRLFQEYFFNLWD